jgi:amino acid transporter
MRTTHTAVLILTLIAVTFGAYLMAFSSSPALAVPFLSASSIAFLRREDLKHEIPKKDAQWAIVFLVLFLVFLIGSALMGKTKESNEWFSHWPYRPHIAFAVWLLLIFGTYRSYRIYLAALVSKK